LINSYQQPQSDLTGFKDNDDPSHTELIHSYARLGSRSTLLDSEGSSSPKRLKNPKLVIVDHEQENTAFPNLKPIV